MLSGPGGAGKSGTVLAGIAFGLQTAGDDYVLLDQRGAPNLFSIYRIMKQDSGGISRIAGLQERLGRVRENWQGKFEFDLDGVFPNCRVASMPLDAVIMPRITHSDRSTFDAVTRQDAINRLTRSMVSELPDDPRQILIAFAKLTNRVPTFAMNLSESPKEIAATLARFLERGGP